MKIGAYLFFTAAVAFSFLTVTKILWKFDLLDFRVYHSSASYFIQGKNPYNPADNGMSLIYPPPAVLFLSWLAVFPLSIAENIWTILSFGSLFLSIYFLLKSVSEKISLFDFLCIYSFTVLAFPTRFTLGMGQINLFILLLMSATLYFAQKEKHTLVGVVLAIATSIKISPIVLILIFIKQKNIKFLQSFFATLFILFGLSFLIVGQSVFIRYFLNIFPNLPTVGNASYYNQAFTGFLARASVPDNIAKVLQYGSLGLSFLLSYILLTKKPTPITNLLGAGLLITLGLIFGGLTWQHHLVLLVVPFTGLYVHFLQQEKKNLMTIGALVVAYLLVAYNFKSPETVVLPAVILSHGLWGMIILSGLVLYCLQQEKNN